MTEPLALGVQSPQINTVPTFNATQSNAVATLSAEQQQQAAALERIAQYGFGVMGGKLDGPIDPKRLDTMLSLLGNSPLAAQIKANPDLLRVITRGSANVVAQAQNAQQFELAKEQFDRQLQLTQSEVMKNMAETSMYTNGGPPAGNAVQDANGNWFQPTQGGTMRPMSMAGQPTAPMDTPPAPAGDVAPVVASPGGVAAATAPVGVSSTGPTADVPAPAPLTAPTAQSASPQTPTFLTPVQLEGQKGYAAQRGKDLAGTMSDLQVQSQNAQSTLGQLSALDAALKTTPQGWGADTLQNVRKMAQSLGIDVGNTGPGDLINSISNQLALTLRNPANGGGMPGALSDSDRQFLTSMVPGLTNSPNGNKYIIEAAKLLFQRKTELAKMATDYAKAHGGQIDDTFMGQIQDYANSHPIFDALTKQISGDTAAPTTVDPTKMSDDELKQALGIQ